ncbi:hypothetical protein Tco_1117352 [Tanacetum coccineum]
MVRSSDNLADLFTKALPTATFKKLVHSTEMRRLGELNSDDTTSSNDTSSDDPSSDETTFDDTTKKPKTTARKGPTKELFKWYDDTTDEDIAQFKVPSKSKGSTFKPKRFKLKKL